VFPRLRQRICTATLDRLDVLIELSTLGEYGLGEDGRPLALAETASDPVPGRPIRLRDDCPLDRPPVSPHCYAPAAL
jgi:hypothetical protein